MLVLIRFGDRQGGGDGQSHKCLSGCFVQISGQKKCIRELGQFHTLHPGSGDRAALQSC